MSNLSDEAKVISAENSSTEVISAFNRIPYGLINREVQGSANDVLAELTEICGFYRVYKDGAKFQPEGSNGDYVPSQLHYKMASSLIDKEARFLFAESPTISIETKSVGNMSTSETKAQVDNLDEMVHSILDENKFDQQLLKAARDCFIGKRVACLVNFNEEDGVTVTFIPSTQFIYEYKMNSQQLKKFVAFIIVKDSITLSKRLVFMKRYEVVDNAVMLDEALYDGAGKLVEVVTESMQIKLDRIPAVVITNDGLLGDIDGESEIEVLKQYESLYSKLANADIDAGRKSMNQIKYGIDLDPNSTKGLSTAPGSFWDLGSNQDIEHPSTSIGTIESSMSYSPSLDVTLRRIKSTGYEQIDMPDITLENMTGVISSGKALKAVYWPLIVRCKEKMKTWGPQLQHLIELIVDGAIAYPNTVVKYTDVTPTPTLYEVHVSHNLPLPEDEVEEKNMDLSEVSSMTMSKKTYMKKWHDLTDAEVDEELSQIALERQILEDASFGFNDGDTFGGAPYGDSSDGDISGEDANGPQKHSDDI